MADWQSLSLQELEAMCDKRLLDFYQSFCEDDPEEYRQEIIKHLKRYNLPTDEVLDAIRTSPTPGEAWHAALSVCRRTIPAAPWDELAPPELEADITDAQAWLARQLPHMPEATGIYLGLDTLNMRGGQGKNVEIGGTSACDPFDDSQDWLSHQLTRGTRHLIRGLYELHSAYTKGSWRVLDDEVPLGSYASFADYTVFLCYSGIVLGHALSRLQESRTFLAVWGYHDGDMFLLGRNEPKGFTFLCR
jgi:hypothetical protein